MNTGRVHQASGRQLLLAAPPSGANLAAFAAWRRLRGPDGAAPFLADRLQGLHALTLRPGGLPARGSRSIAAALFYHFNLHISS